jgi:hypothetical protein
MSRKFTAIKYCNWCGDPFEVKSPNQKYCHPDIKNCSQESKRESWRNAAYKYREKYKEIVSIPQVYKLGSGWLGSKAKTDFDEEYYSIQKEKKRLKINTVIVGASLWFQLNNQFLIRNILNRNNAPVYELSPELVVFVLLLITFLVFGIYIDHTIN